MTSTASSAWIAYLKLSLTMLLWGVAWPVGRFLAVDLPPISIAMLRYALVVPVFFLILLLWERSWRIPRSWVGTFVVLGVLSTTLYQAFFMFGVRFAAASDDSLVIGLNPLVVAVLASFVVKEPLGWQKIVGLLLGLVGVGLISQLSPNSQALNRPLGMSLVFCGVIAYSLYTVYLRRFITSHGSPVNGGKLSSLAIISWVSFFGWLILVPFSVLEAPWNYTWDANSWVGIVYLALFSTVVGYLFFVEGVSEIGAGRASIFINLVPVFGVLSSALILGELVNLWHAVSFALIFVGVYLVNRFR